MDTLTLLRLSIHDIRSNYAGINWRFELQEAGLSIHATLQNWHQAKFIPWADLEDFRVPTLQAICKEVAKAFIHQGP